MAIIRQALLHVPDRRLQPAVSFDMHAAWRKAQLRTHDERQRLQHQRIASAPQVQHFAIGFGDDTQRAEAKAAGVQVSLEANPLAAPMKAKIPHVGIGWVVSTLPAQPAVGLVEHRRKRLHICGGRAAATRQYR